MNIQDKETIDLYAKPGKRETKIKKYDEYRGRYVMYVKEPAKDGKANREILRFFNEQTSKEWMMIAGKKGKKKTLKTR